MESMVSSERYAGSANKKFSGLVHQKQTMSSRQVILSAIATGKPALTPLPLLPAQPLDEEAFVRIQKFTTLLELIGGKAIAVEDLGEPSKHLQSLLKEGKLVACLCSGVGEGNTAINCALSAADLETVHTAFIEGSFGVAENGAVWLQESQMVNRLLPFICQHLVIIIKGSSILSDMHEAYRSINVAAEGYGLFLAGPSKTADIEQSLVIGAHGARTATVYIIVNK
jgi:L-lactate dehydrogenase complex protein LldG